MPITHNLGPIPIGPEATQLRDNHLSLLTHLDYIGIDTSRLTATQFSSLLISLEEDTPQMHRCNKCGAPCSGVTNLNPFVLQSSLLTHLPRRDEVGWAPISRQRG